MLDMTPADIGVERHSTECVSLLTLAASEDSKTTAGHLDEVISSTRSEEQQQKAFMDMMELFKDVGRETHFEMPDESGLKPAHFKIDDVLDKSSLSSPTQEKRKMMHELTSQSEHDEKVEKVVKEKVKPKEVDLTLDDDDDNDGDTPLPPHPVTEAPRPDISVITDEPLPRRPSKEAPRPITP